MRCSCHVCDTYMVQSEGLELGCVCPDCGYRCTDCLGTKTLISRETLLRIVEIYGIGKIQPYDQQRIDHHIVPIEHSFPPAALT